MKKELNNIKDVKTYADFVEWFDINLVLNNDLIPYAQENGLTIETENWIDEYETPNGDIITQDELDEIELNDENFDINDYFELDKEFYQYYIVNSRDAETIQDLTDDVIFYIEELDVCLWGIEHYGSSWDIVPISLNLEE